MHSHEIGVWEIQGGFLVCKYDGSRLRRPSGLIFSQDGHLFSHNCGNSVGRVVETRTRLCERIWDLIWRSFRRSNESPNGKYIVEKDWQKWEIEGVITYCIWERQAGKEGSRLRCEVGESQGKPTYSPDSSLVALVSNENMMKIWETETGLHRRAPCRPLQCARTIVFSDDNRFIVYTPGHGTTLAVLELRTGRTGTLLFACANPVALAIFSSDTTILAVVSDGVIWVWETSFGSIPKKLDDDKREEGRCINIIAFSPNQKVLAAGYEDGSIRLWEMGNYSLIRTLENEGPVRQLAFDSKSRFIWTGKKGFFLDDCLQHCSEHEPKETDVSIVEDWVLFRGKRVLWLPPEYRYVSHKVVGVNGNSLLIGHQSGDVTYISFCL